MALGDLGVLAFQKKTHGCAVPDPLATDCHPIDKDIEECESP